MNRAFIVAGCGSGTLRVRFGLLANAVSKPCYKLTIFYERRMCATLPCYRLAILGVYNVQETGSWIKPDKLVDYDRCKHAYTHTHRALNSNSTQDSAGLHQRKQTTIYSLPSMAPRPVTPNPKPKP